MNRRMLGITVLGDYIVSEGPQIVLENLLRIGATAVAINPTVTCQGDRSTGKFQPPSDAGHSPRKFDRPLFGKHALWVRSAPSFHPRSELYPESPYRPRQTNELTDELGGLIGQFIDACLGEGIDVYLQVGAAEPSGLRDEDRPRLPDGSLPSGRIADVGSLASPAIRAYNRAYANDLAEPDFVVELNAALIFLYSIGAIVSPAVSAWLIALSGPSAMFTFMAAVHGALVIFTLYRMPRRAGTGPRTPYRYLPRTSMLLGRMFKSGNGANGKT